MLKCLRFLLKETRTQFSTYFVLGINIFIYFFIKFVYLFSDGHDDHDLDGEERESRDDVLREQVSYPCIPVYIPPTLPSLRKIKNCSPFT